MIAAQWSAVDWVFVAISGFLLGAFAYTGWYTVHHEPEIRWGYAMIGAGIVVSVGINAYIDFTHDISDLFRGLTLIGYAFVAIGLTLVTRERHRRRS